MVVYTGVYSLSALRLGRSQEHTKSPRTRVRLRVRDTDLEKTTLERADARRDYGERRMIALGMAQDIQLTVVYTDRADAGKDTQRRIISARKSSRREREAYRKSTSPK